MSHQVKSDLINIVFLDRKALPCILPEFDFPHNLIEYELSEGEQIIERVKDADIIITNKCVLSRAVIENAPRLKMIAVTATGYNIIDINAANERSIKVANVAGYSSKGVAQHAMGLIFNLMRQLPAYQKAAKDGSWQDSEVFCVLGNPLYELDGLTLGLVGSGNIASTLAGYATAFGMNIIKLDRKNASHIREGYVAFEHGLAQADIISIHCPLTTDTEDLIGLPELKTMKKSSIIINTARGGIVNEAALHFALKHNIIAGAGIDVLTQEAPKNGNILLDSTLSNLLITPHVAWMGESSLKTLAFETVKNIEAFIQGNPRNLVN